MLMSKWQWILKQFGSRLWVRSSLFCVAAVITALLALVFKDYIPEDVSRKVGAEAVDSILHIIASSMLAVTTFSLSTMVAAYSAATSNVTPRSTQLLLQDSTAQNALSVFIGAFLYSLVGIIALRMEVYGDSGRLILFIVTIAVIVLIVGVLLQWINYLSRLGRVGETIDMVEKATARAIRQRLGVPFLGGVEMNDYTPRQGHHPACCGQIGYIQHIDIGKLARLAEKLNATFYLMMTTGSFNDGVKPLLYSTVKLDEESLPDACDAYSIGDNRSFEQDPRFGLIVLGEVASRALSPAVNDAGTAIDVIGTSMRLLAPWVMHDAPPPEPVYPNIHIPSMKTADLFDDVFAPLARDGAANVQIGIRVQKALMSLALMGHEDAHKQAVRLSRYAWEYAKNALVLDVDKEAISSLVKELEKQAKGAK